MSHLGGHSILMKLLGSYTEVLHHLVRHESRGIVMPGVADINPVDHRDILDGLMRDLLQLFLIRFHRDNLHHEVSLHVLVLGELLCIHLRDLLDCLVQAGKELAHNGCQALRILNHLVVEVMQVHGHGCVLSFGTYGEPHIGLSLQLFHLLDGHIRFRMVGLRRILCDIQEIFIAHRHNQAPP